MRWADGLRRVDAVHVYVNERPALVAVGVAHRMPVTLPITLASAAVSRRSEFR